MTRALVIGGAGFVGSHLCEALLDEGTPVVALDNLGSGRRENLNSILGRDDFEFVEGDVRDPLEPQLESPERIDTVFHFASRASPTDFDEHALEIADTNSVGTRNVLEFARETDRTVVYASTSEVYGDPEEHPQSETYFGNVNIRGPRAPYDESKRFGETLCETYFQSHDVDARTVRIFNTYGPRMRPNDGRVIPTFVNQALAGENLSVYGDGEQTRSFCYVDDLVRGILLLAAGDDLAGEVMNLGHTNEITIRKLASVTRDTINEDIEVEHQPLPEDDPQRRQPDITRARELLGWEPEVGLEEGLKRTASYFSEA